jgi:hypothetical protein
LREPCQMHSSTQEELHEVLYMANLYNLRHCIAKDDSRYELMAGDPVPPTPEELEEESNEERWLYFAKLALPKAPEESEDQRKRSKPSDKKPKRQR